MAFHAFYSRVRIAAKTLLLLRAYIRNCILICNTEVRNAVTITVAVTIGPKRKRERKRDSASSRLTRNQLFEQNDTIRRWNR